MRGVVISIKDRKYDDYEVCRVNFASLEEAELHKNSLFEVFFSWYGSGSCGFYGTYVEEDSKPSISGLNLISGALENEDCPYFEDEEWPHSIDYL